MHGDSHLLYADDLSFFLKLLNLRSILERMMQMIPF